MNWHVWPSDRRRKEAKRQREEEPERKFTTKRLLEGLLDGLSLLNKLLLANYYNNSRMI